jgi:hypothetical protein
MSGHADLVTTALLPAPSPGQPHPIDASQAPTATPSPDTTFDDRKFTSVSSSFFWAALRDKYDTLGYDYSVLEKRNLSVAFDAQAPGNSGYEPTPKSI